MTSESQKEEIERKIEERDKFRKQQKQERRAFWKGQVLPMLALIWIVLPLLIWIANNW